MPGEILHRMLIHIKDEIGLNIMPRKKTEMANWILDFIISVYTLEYNAKFIF